MAGANQAGLSSSRWAVSPTPGPKGEKTKPASNRAVSNDPQVQTQVYDRVTTMTTRRPDSVESAIPNIATHEDHKVQGNNSESVQVNTVGVQTPNVEPAQVAQAHFRPVQEIDPFQPSSHTNDDEQRLEESFMKNLKRNVERITAHNQELESKRTERSVKFKLDDARHASEKHTEDKQGADIMAPNIYSHQINDILKSDNRIETEASKRADATIDLMPAGKASPHVQVADVSAIVGKPSLKMGKMVHWDMELKKGEEAREKLELEFQKWVTQYEQERATLVGNRDTWIERRLEAEKVCGEAQAMITQFDQEIEDKDRKHASFTSTYRELIKDLCIEMASLAVSL